jgi:hypothetical protein
MGIRRGQIPESFLRQSVPIKVRVTVGKLKQKQELQRSTGDMEWTERRLQRGQRAPEKEAPNTSDYSYQATHATHLGRQK